MKTLTAEQFRKQYGIGGVASIAQTKLPNAAQRVQADIQQRGADIVDTLGDNTKSPIRRGFEATATAFNAIPSTAVNVLPEPAREVVGKATEAIGGLVGKLSDKVSDSTKLQEWVINHPEASSALEDVLGTTAAAGQIAGDILISDQATKGAQLGADAAKVGAERVGQATGEIASKVGGKLGAVAEGQPAAIMNRVARLKPKDATKFEQLAGQTQGEYLVKTGNFGTPDKIIANESAKFVQSLNSVDDALAQLPGVYKTGPIKDALTELYKKAQSVSSDSVKAPYLTEVRALVNKYNSGGLTMSEINRVKRLFEREVKLGYRGVSAQINSDAVARATNIDSAIRSWQVEQASTLGFKNIAELNKQTQLSRFLVDKLGAQLVGKNGLNGINLTDWVVLSGGNPQAVAGFLTKKFFSSKGIQAKIAEMLNKEGVQGQILPEMGASQVLGLPAPLEGATRSGINTPINQPSRRAIQSGTEVVPRSTRQTPQ